MPRPPPRAEPGIRAATVLVGLLWSVAPAGGQGDDSARAARLAVPGAFVGLIKNSVDRTPVRSADVRLYFIDSARAVRDTDGTSSLETFIDTTRSRLGVSDSTGYFTIWR